MPEFSAWVAAAEAIERASIGDSFYLALFTGHDIPCDPSCSGDGFLLSGLYRERSVNLVNSSHGVRRTTYDVRPQNVARDPFRSRQPFP
jgi:hypothetical protein